MTKANFNRKRKNHFKRGLSDGLPQAVKLEKEIEKLLVTSQEMLLSDEDRLTYTYKLDKANTVKEVTCVSFEVNSFGKWETIIYYDSFHDGKLHRHQIVSEELDLETATTENVISTGSQKELLTWAITDIKHNYISYKQLYFKVKRQSIDM